MLFVGIGHLASFVSEEILQIQETDWIKNKKETTSYVTYFFLEMQRQQAKTKRPHMLVRRKKEKKFQLAKVEETVLCERLKNEILSVPVSKCA